MTRRGRLALILVLIVPLVALGMVKAGWILYSGGPYRGQVLDAETRQPLEGAVAFFQWNRRVYGGLEVRTTFLSAVEALTDKEGRFHVLWFIGTSLNPFSVVLEPRWFVYYPGYKSQQVVVTPPTGRLLKDPTVIIKRRILDREERLCAVDVLPGGVPDKAMPNLIRLVNMESVALGLQPVRVRAGNRR